MSPVAGPSGGDGLKQFWNLFSDFEVMHLYSGSEQLVFESQWDRCMDIRPHYVIFDITSITLSSTTVIITGNV